MSPNSPNSLPPVRPQSNSPSDKVDDNDIETLFDPRPQVANGQADFFKSAIAAFSKACSDAAAWVAQVLARLGIGREPVIHVAARLPEVDNSMAVTPLQPAMPEARDHSPMDGGMVAAADLPTESADDRVHHEIEAARKDFVEAKDALRKDQALAPAAHEEAFGNYVRLCKKNNKEPGSIDCPKNFKEGAVRYAQAFVDLVSKRRLWATATDNEFWLRPADQDTYRNALRFLELQVEDKPESALSPFEPIHTHSTRQLHSFEAWRNRDKQSQTDLGYDPSKLTIDAAINYADTLIALHAGTEQARREPLKGRLADAFELLNNEALHRLTFTGNQDLQAMLMDMQEFKSIKVKPDTQKLTKKDDASVAGKAPDPGEAIRDVSVLQDAPSDARPEATKAASTAIDAGVIPEPPVVQPSSVQPPQSSTLAQLNPIPDWSTLDTRLQAQGTTLLNEFFRRYVPQIERGVTDFTVEPQYFSQLAASAASDFLNRVNAPDHQLTLADMSKSTAANRIVREYLRRVTPGPRPGT